MELQVHGHPLHTRSLSITLYAVDAESMRVSAELVDLRKRGFVPVGADLQPAGIVHLMQLEAEVDFAARRLRRIEAKQPRVAFEASERTAGESCRDPAGRVNHLAGAGLGDGWARAVGEQIGGPRGCTHILTLAQLLGSTVTWALESEELRNFDADAWPDGAKLFRRDLVFDGHCEDGRLQMVGQLTDLAFRPAAAVAPPLERFGGLYELRLAAEVESERFSITSLRAADRHRSIDGVATPWRDLGSDVDDLVGTELRAGVSGTILRQLAGRSEAQPLLAALLNLTPAYYQCLANLGEDAPFDVRHRADVVGMGGLPGSCYMWRTDGALHQLRTEQRQQSRHEPEKVTS